MNPLRILNLLFAALIISGPMAAQEVSIIFMNRSESIFQTGPDSYEGAEGRGLEGWTNFRVSAGIMANSDAITDARLAGPSYHEGVPLIWDDGEYNFNEDFSTEEELRQSVPAGTYTFSGTGNSVGPFSENLTVTEFSSIAPKLIQNYSELQAVDPEQPMTVQLAEFNDLNGNEGFISMTVAYLDNGGFSEVFDTRELISEGSLGLDPSTTEVVVPAGRLVGSPTNVYDAVVSYVRIAESGEPAAFPGALLALATSMEVFFQIRPTSIWSDFEYIDGWLKGWLGWIKELNSEYIYHLNLGTIYYAAEDNESIWMYIYNGETGWIWLGKSVYPYLYVWSLGWVYHQPDSNWMYDLQSAEWFQIVPESA